MVPMDVLRSDRNKESNTFYCVALPSAVRSHGSLLPPVCHLRYEGELYEEEDLEMC